MCIQKCSYFRPPGYAISTIMDYGIHVDYVSDVVDVDKDIVINGIIKHLGDTCGTYSESEMQVSHLRTTINANIAAGH